MMKTEQHKVRTLYEDWRVSSSRSLRLIFTSPVLATTLK